MPRYRSIIGNLCKLSVALNGRVPSYSLLFKDASQRMPALDMPQPTIGFNDLIGNQVQIEYHGYYNSLKSGVKVTAVDLLKFV